MAEKVVLKIMRCPTCGANLKAENNSDPITCVYCGNTIVPVNFSARESAGETDAGKTVRVEGIRTSASALAYMEEFYDEYDWEAFAYAQSLSVLETDILADSLKSSAADDKNTWFVCFNAVFVPFNHKAASCEALLSTVVREYIDGSLDTYSTFDAYRRISAKLSDSRPGIVAKLEKYAAKAEKYGATAEETAALREKITGIRNLSLGPVHRNIEQIPEIHAHILQKNTDITEALAAKGIDARAEYGKAKELMERQQYFRALKILLTLEGYADTEELIKKTNRFFRMDDTLEICGKLYCMKAEDSEFGGFHLYPTEEGRISGKALISGIRVLICNFADVLYYLDRNQKLCQYCLSDGFAACIDERHLSREDIYYHGGKIFLRTAQSEESSIGSILLALDPASGTVETLLGNIGNILFMKGSKLVYNVIERNAGNEWQDMEHQEALSHRTFTNVIDVKTGNVVCLDNGKITVEGFLDDCVIYTKESPNSYNKDLYIRPFRGANAGTLLEQNVYAFCDIVGDRLFYYVGNSRNRTLIQLKSDGTGRREFHHHISRILFERGGWLYFIHRAGHNSVLCKSRMDGTGRKIIAGDIDSFVEIKNGYLYYINDDSALFKVRMDGTNLQKLCDDVKSVLSVKDDKIVFLSVDDRIVTGAFEMETVKTVESIYAMDFSGSGKRKLAYNVRSAQKYDEDTVYYIAEPHSEAETTNEHLYKLDVGSNTCDDLLELQVTEENQGGISGFTVAMIIMAVAFFFSFVGYVSSIPTLGGFSLAVGLAALLVGLGIRANKDR